MMFNIKAHEIKTEYILDIIEFRTCYQSMRYQKPERIVIREE